MSYEKIYRQMVLEHLGREPRQNEGLSDEEIEQAEKRFGFRFPESLRLYYRITGNLPELNQRHNRLLNLSDLDVENGFLIFMEENQNVVYWAIKVSETANSDPEVWQIINEELREFYPERKTFSKFIVEMMNWQLGELPKLENQ